MTKSDIADIIREEMSIDKKDILFVMDRFLEEIVAAADKGDTVEIRGFGTFSRAERKARKVFSNFAQKKLDVPARKILMFKASKHTDIVV